MQSHCAKYFHMVLPKAEETRCHGRYAGSLTSGSSAQCHRLGGVPAPWIAAERPKASAGLGLSGRNSTRPAMGALGGLSSACRGQRSGPEPARGAGHVAVAITPCFAEAASGLHKQALEARPRTSARLNQSIAAGSKSDSKLII